MNGTAYGWRLALNALHLLESIKESMRARFQVIEDAIILLLIELITGLSLFRWVDHELNNALAQNRRAQLNANELVDLSSHSLVEAHKLKVSAALTALADHTLGDTVQRGQLNVVVLAGLFLLKVSQRLLE